jgi:CelD/BcsL family acetyltransferase involved in cellulose biosynthesis
MSITQTGTATARTALAKSYHVRVFKGWAAANWQWRPGQATAFQRPEWLESLYAAIARHEPDIQPLTVEVLDRQGAQAYRLALLRRRIGSRRIIEFADLNMTDFNAPLLGPAAPRTAAEAARAWKAVKRSLPRCDALRFTKMPPMIGGRPNPLTLLAGLLPAAVNGNLVTIGEDWNAFHFGLERTVRKELERSWRVFSRAENTGLHAVTDPEAGLSVLARMEVLQSRRMREIGQPYTMDDPVTADFYRRLIARGLESGYAVLTLLRSHNELVAALLGVRDGDSYVMIRLAHAGADWSRVSPGRLLIHKTLERLHAEGCRHFDFSVGNYAYKRRFGPVRTPLFDYVEARSPKGVPMALHARTAGWLRRCPALREYVRRLMGKPASREEI